MKFIVHFDEKAEFELLNYAKWYETQRKGLSEYVISEIESNIEKII